MPLSQEGTVDKMNHAEGKEIMKPQKKPEEDDDEIELPEEVHKEEIQLAKKIREKEEKVKERRSKITLVRENTLSIEDALKEGRDDSLLPARGELAPEELTPQQLNEGIVRTLCSENPYLDTNLVIFNFEKREFEKIINNSHEVVLYELEGYVIHTASPDAEEQETRLKKEAKWAQRIESINEKNKQLLRVKVDEKLKKNRREKEALARGIPIEELEEVLSETEEVNEDVGGEEEGTGTLIMKEEEKELPPKKLVNRFNFSDRSVLTYTCITRDKATQTTPNPRANFAGHVTQWIIYDHYQKDYEALQEAKEKERQAKMIMTTKKEDRSFKKPVKTEDPIYERMAKSIKILERMLNQNTYDNIAQDCQFYEDPGDKYRLEEGVLLPLWEFKYANAKGLSASEIKWNPAYKDLFGVTFSVLDFEEEDKTGVLSIFTLKNPSYPEFVRHFDSGALCLDFHPSKCHYVCVGLHDGSVSVLNMQNANNENQIPSDVNHSHRSHVWSVLWCDDNRDRQLSFFSAGGDGRICKWLLLQNELLHSPIITLYVDKHDINTKGSYIKIPTSPRCLTFHPNNFEIFMVGTALGTIYKCSVSYASTYFYHMKAHEQSVNRITFNKFNSNIFATAGGDWRLKIWEDGKPRPLFIYNLDSPVEDAQWSPYSSTVIAAINAVGKVFFYDLNVNKYLPMCSQCVIPPEDSIATCISFNPTGQKMPLILVGDSRGKVTTMKISPNLRIKPKLPRKRGDSTVQVDETALEIEKLEKILCYVRETLIRRHILEGGTEILT